MATTVPIGSFSLTAGQTKQAVAPISDSTMPIKVTLDRTAGASNLDSLPATTAMTVLSETSFDGGVTFPVQDSVTIVGGPVTSGRPPVTVHVTTFGYPEGVGSSGGHPGDHLRVTVHAEQTVTGAGTITLG